jgi:hypothetical protein
MTHIVFNEADVSILTEAMGLNEDLQGTIELIRDDYAVGPILNGYVGEGRSVRSDWWKELLKGTEWETREDRPVVDDFSVIARIVGQLQREEEDTVWIWMAQNQHDVCGYYWLLHFLKPFQGKVWVLYLNNLPFINEKGGIFYPTWLSQIPAQEFRKAKKLARIITPSEFEIDPDEWKRLMEENAIVRILEGGKKIVSRDADFFDKEILQFCGNDWMKASKLLQQTLQKMKIKTGDVFLAWRIKTMIEQGVLSAQGDLFKTWKDFEVKPNNSQ